MTCTEAKQMVIPYIRDELTDRELASFLDHISSCEDCHGELEIYFTIYAALAQLEGENESRNIPALLESSLKAAQKRVRNRRIFETVYNLSRILAMLILAVLIVTEIF